MENVGRSHCPKFLLKTYTVVDDSKTDDVVSWNPDGTTFVIWQPIEFANDILPTVFKHNNFSSFVRQLNTYGFHKVSPNRWEFTNVLFRKGAKNQLYEIYPKKAVCHIPRDIRLPEPSSSELTNLISENTSLQQENDVLNSELEVMKNKFDKLVDLARIYGTNNIESEGPKIFGVRLSARKKGKNGEND